MIGVDPTSEIRRAYFEQHRPVKEIVRTLLVSRATVRKIVRSHKTEHRYERAVQPAPRLDEWVTVLTEILEKEACLPRRKRRSTQCLFEDLRDRGYDGAHDRVHRISINGLGILHGRLLDRGMEMPSRVSVCPAAHEIAGQRCSISPRP